jgi:uncharacterized protein (TIGR03545 family)
MSDPNSAANPNPQDSNSRPDSPTLSAADLAKAVLGAAETVARASAGDAPGAVKTGLQTAAASASPEPKNPEEPSSVVPAPHIPLPSAEPTPESVAQIAGAVSSPVPVSVSPSDVAPETPDAKATADEEKKKPGLGPRWSYIITRGLAVALVWAFFTYVFDPLIRFGAVQSTQHVVGAKVDVEQFSTEFFPPQIHIGHVAVANRKAPMTNLLQFESLTGDVDGLALMKKSYILNKAVVTGLRWGTERSESGLLDDADAIEEEEQDKGKSELLSKLEQAGKEWANELLGRASLKYDPKNLETYVLADQLEDEWKTDFDDLELRVEDVETQAKKLKELFNVAKRDPLRNLAKIDQIVKEGLRLKGQLREIRTDVGRLPPKAQQDLNELNASRRRDTDRIQREIKDLVLNEDNLSEFLLGPELHHRITQAVSWLQWTDERVDRFGSAKPIRTRGEVIAFTDRNPLPGYLVRLIDVSGEGEIAGDQLTILGTISDVTNDPVLHGKPTVVRLEGHGDAIVKLHATIDRTQDVPSNELNLSYELPRPTDEILGDGGSLSILVHAESTEWTANLRTLGEELSGTIVLRQKPVRLTATLKEGTDERLRQIVESSVAAVDEVQATVTLSGTVRDPKWKLRTTLGRKILRGVERGVNDALSAQKEALVAKLDGELKGRQEQFLGKLNGRYGELSKQLQLNDKMLSELNANELIQRVSGGKFDPRKIFKR